MRRVVVTGLGLVTPLGGSVETSWANIIAGKSGAGTITFPATSLRKINLEITSASGTPRIAELETYAG